MTKAQENLAKFYADSISGSVLRDYASGNVKVIDADTHHKNAEIAKAMNDAIRRKLSKEN